MAENTIPKLEKIQNEGNYEYHKTTEEEVSGMLNYACNLLQNKIFFCDSLEELNVEILFVRVLFCGIVCIL